MAKSYPYAQMTKALFESQGFIVGTTEHWNSFAGNRIPESHVCGNCHAKITIWKPAGKRQDLFGFSDLIAFRPDRPDVSLVQCTSYSNHPHRKQKIIENAVAWDWVQSEYRNIIIVSWSKKPKKLKDGSKSKRSYWNPRTEALTDSDFAQFERDPF